MASARRDGEVSGYFVKLNAGGGLGGGERLEATLTVLPPNEMRASLACRWGADPAIAIDTALSPPNPPRFLEFSRRDVGKPKGEAPVEPELRFVPKSSGGILAVPRSSVSLTVLQLIPHKKRKVLLMKFAEIRRRYGAGAACHALGYKLAQRFLVLDVTHLMVLDTSAGQSASEIQATFRPLSFDEVVEFAHDPASQLDVTVAQRLCDNLDVCFAALIDERLAGYYWLAWDSIEAIHNRGDSTESGVALSYPEDLVFTYKAFVHPSFRGQGVYTAMVHAAARWAREEQGIQYLVSTADWTNYAALRSCRRQGFRSLGHVWRIGAPGCMLTFGPAKADQYGIRLGEDARVTRRYQPVANIVEQETVEQETVEQETVGVSAFT